MACESARRQSVYLKIGCNAYHKRDPTSQPMSFWTEQDVLEYLRMTGIPYSSVYGEIVEENGRLTTTGAKRTGCMFCMFGVHLEEGAEPLSAHGADTSQAVRVLYPQIGLRQGAGLSRRTVCPEWR